MPAFLVRFLSLFGLALWVGGGAVLSFVVAPTLFERAGSRRSAGELVGHVLHRFDRYVLGLGAIALACTLLEVAATVGAARTLGLKLALVAAMIGLSLYRRFALSPEIRRLRDALGERVDVLPTDHPERAAFRRLHGYSVLCLMGEMVLGALAMALSVMILGTQLG